MRKFSFPYLRCERVLGSFSFLFLFDVVFDTNPRDDLGPTTRKNKKTHSQILSYDPRSFLHQCCGGINCSLGLFFSCFIFFCFIFFYFFLFFFLSPSFFFSFPFYLSLLHKVFFTRGPPNGVALRKHQEKRNENYFYSAGMLFVTKELHGIT